MNIKRIIKQVIDSYDLDTRLALALAVVTPNDINHRLDIIHLARGVKKATSRYQYIEELDGHYQWLHRSYIGHRSIEKRFNAIASKVDGDHRSIIDIGCNFGMLSFALAEKGHHCVGIEYDPTIVDVPRRIASIRGGHHVGFMQAEFNPEFCDTMPTYDYGMCLSLIHHIIIAHGTDYSIELLSKLRRKIRYGLFLDMASSNEPGFEDTTLPDMGENHDEWIVEFLKSAGFSTIEPLVEEGGDNRTPRTLFFAGI